MPLYTNFNCTARIGITLLIVNSGVKHTDKAQRERAKRGQCTHSLGMQNVDMAAVGNTKQNFRCKFFYI